MKYNRIGTGERAAVLSTTFDKCLLDNGTNYLDLEQNNLEKCENKKQFFIPRGFALSIWEILLETAYQFGYEVL